jgi:hypothetical protein
MMKQERRMKTVHDRSLLSSGVLASSSAAGGGAAAARRHVLRVFMRFMLVL